MRVVIGVYMVRYPLGGMLSWGLQWVAGFKKLGLDVFIVEKSDGPGTCFDPTANEMVDDCSYGIATLVDTLRPFGLEENWCFVTSANRYEGMSRDRVENVFGSADLFLDLGTHGAWLPEAEGTDLRVLVDGEPGYKQMKWEKDLQEGRPLPCYDRYFTNGLNLGSARTRAPTAGLRWEPIVNPVFLEMFDATLPNPESPFTTVMNWQSHPPVDYEGVRYGQKDVEFLKFIDIPRHARARLEVAVAGDAVPHEKLVANGWATRSAQEVTRTLDSYRRYLRDSKGEFSVCKEVFVAGRTGWFSDRSAAYLASGRPVILEDTGFSDVLPCGEGLLPFSSSRDAVNALASVDGDLVAHSEAAKAIAEDHLATDVVLPRFLSSLGM